MLAKAVAEVLKKHPIVNAAYVEGGIKYNKGTRLLHTASFHHAPRTVLQHTIPHYHTLRTVPHHYTLYHTLHLSTPHTVPHTAP